MSGSYSLDRKGMKLVAGTLLLLIVFCFLAYVFSGDHRKANGDTLMAYDQIPKVPMMGLPVGGEALHDDLLEVVAIHSFTGREVEVVPKVKQWAAMNVYSNTSTVHFDNVGHVQKDIRVATIALKDGNKSLPEVVSSVQQRYYFGERSSCHDAYLVFSKRFRESYSAHFPPNQTAQSMRTGVGVLNKAEDALFYEGRAHRFSIEDACGELSDLDSGQITIVGALNDEALQSVGAHVRSVSLDTALYKGLLRGMLSD